MFRTPAWDVFRGKHWVGMANGETEEEALKSITLEPTDVPFKVIRWYGRRDPRNCVESGGNVPNPK